MNFMLALAVGFTVALATMRVFGPNMVVFWREAAPGVGMGIPKGAYFVAKTIVELPRLALLVLALLSTFYPMASPRCPFALYFAIFYGAAVAVSGWATLLSIAQDPKSAQLSAVVVVVVFAMFCGVAPRLPQLAQMGGYAVAMARLSFGRWFIECLYVEETVRMSDAWRMPPTFYDSPSKESVLLGLQSMGYVERSTLYNVLIMIIMGIVLRLVAFIALCHCNRDKMGLRSLSDLGRSVFHGTIAAAARCCSSLIQHSGRLCSRNASPLHSRVSSSVLSASSPLSPSSSSSSSYSTALSPASETPDAPRGSSRFISMAMLGWLGLSIIDDDEEYYSEDYCESPSGVLQPNSSEHGVSGTEIELPQFPLPTTAAGSSLP